MSGAQHSRRKPAHVATYYGFVRILCTIRTKKDTKKTQKAVRSDAAVSERGIGMMACPA